MFSLTADKYIILAFEDAAQARSSTYTQNTTVAAQPTTAELPLCLEMLQLCEERALQTALCKPSAGPTVHFWNGKDKIWNKAAPLQAGLQGN